jgi:hypothetical protein
MKNIEEKKRKLILAYEVSNLFHLVNYLETKNVAFLENILELKKEIKQLREINLN